MSSLFELGFGQGSFDSFSILEYVARGLAGS